MSELKSRSCSRLENECRTARQSFSSLRDCVPGMRRLSGLPWGKVAVIRAPGHDGVGCKVIVVVVDGNGCQKGDIHSPRRVQGSDRTSPGM